jgi:hypothetical protein
LACVALGGVCLLPFWPLVELLCLLQPRLIEVRWWIWGFLASGVFGNFIVNHPFRKFEWYEW